MRATKKTFFLLSLFSLLVVISCQKNKHGNENDEKIENKDYVIEKDTIIKNSKEIQKKFDANFESLVQQIPDSTAKKYVESYYSNFKPTLDSDSKFPLGILVWNSVIKEIQDKIPTTAKYVNFIFTDNGGKLDIVFDDKINQKKYLISRLSNMKDITNKFAAMNQQFMRNQGIYEEMNRIKGSLSGSNTSIKNTIEIAIPRNEFMSYNSNEYGKFVTFLPGIVTDGGISGKTNKKNHLTLVMAVLKSTHSILDEEFWIWDDYLYFDNFCLNPPETC